MVSTQSTTGDVSSKQLPRARDQISQLVEQFRLDLYEGASLNGSAAQHLVARSTAQNWLRNRSRLEQQAELSRRLQLLLNAVSRTSAKKKNHGWPNKFPIVKSRCVRTRRFIHRSAWLQ